MDLTVLFKTLGDETRLRITGLLLDSELCVCDIETALAISQANASRHLAKMKSSGMLASRKKAQWIYYSINRKFAAEHPEIMHALTAELMKNKEFKNDMRALATLKKKKAETGC